MEGKKLDEFIQRFCDQRYEENKEGVKEVKLDVKDFKKSIDDKFNTLNNWLIGLLGAAILNLVLIVLNMLKGGMK